MNKTRFSILAVVALAFGLFSGCSLFQQKTTPLTPEQKEAQSVRRAQRITELATYDAGLLSLKDKKNTAQNRAVLSTITNQLAGFLTSSNLSPGDVSSYIASLPIKELRTVEGQMIAGVVLVIVDEVIGESITVDTAKLAPVISSAIRGFGRAILFGELNPPVLFISE